MLMLKGHFTRCSDRLFPLGSFHPPVFLFSFPRFNLFLKKVLLITLYSKTDDVQSLTIMFLWDKSKVRNLSVFLKKYNIETVGLSIDQFLIALSILQLVSSEAHSDHSPRLNT